MQTSGVVAWISRECRCTCEVRIEPKPSPRHCERSEAIHLSACRAMDCFASLAMTVTAVTTCLVRNCALGRVIQYSRDFNDRIEKPRRISGLAEGETRWRSMTAAEASAPQRLQALEGQPLGVADAGQIELADEGGGRLAVAICQRHDGIDGNSLGVHGLPRTVRGRKPRSVLGRRLIRR